MVLAKKYQEHRPGYQSYFNENGTELFPVKKYCNLSENDKLQYKDLEEKLTKFVKELGEVQATLPKSVEKCVKELRSIADGIDTFHKKATIASVVGNSVGIVGRITTIAGIALAPVTFGASLTVTMAGAGVSTAGGITGAASSIADTVNIRKKGKRVEKIIQAVQSDIAHLEELLECINSHIEHMKRLMGVQDGDIVKDSVRGDLEAVRITRLAQLAKISAAASQIASQGAQAAAAVSGVLATLFIFMNIASVAKGAKDLKAGAKAEQAKKIRDVADQMETEFEKIQAAALEVQNGFSFITTIEDF
ncbi:apolipoprotein L6 [Xenopus tropicalis]|uniref:Apolipoprotein L6 n=1 Tax=Xenopus tropicalis TaxID=8364 RepID=A0A8J1JNJ8_XENTR|nr:apolipoprotein L6 [Xenopus tropicalis]